MCDVAALCCGFVGLRRCGRVMWWLCGSAAVWPCDSVAVCGGRFPRLTSILTLSDGLGGLGCVLALAGRYGIMRHFG